MTERLDRIETSIGEIWDVIRENQRQISELRSSVSTLANVVGIHDQQIEQLIQTQQQSQQRFEQLIQTQQQSQQRFEQLIQTQQQSQQRFEQFVERSEQDRALMLQLIQQIAQGRNGG